jgi:hypothetical protein
MPAQPQPFQAALTFGRKYRAPFTVHASPAPLVYRTELTITPSSSNKNPPLSIQPQPAQLPSFFSNSDANKRFQ